VAARIADPNHLRFVPISADSRVVESRAPAGFRGRTFAEIDLRKRFGVFVIGVNGNGGGGPVFLPGPDDAVLDHDNLVLIGREGDLMRLREPRS
jgi:trk system potassium uptake protein TrkA